MSEARVLVEAKNHVLLMGLNRPDKYNAFDLEMYHELSLAYAQLDRDPELRCGLVHAQGEHFTAGLDLPQWASHFAQGHMPELPSGGLDPMGLEGPQVSKPVVIAVKGICYTIGLELALAADIRVAGDDTRFGQIEVKRGIYPVGGSTIRLQQEIGWGNAQRYLLTADEMPASEAYRLGLVQELCAPEEVFDTALGIASTIARMAPLAVKATLNSARLARDQGYDAAAQRLMPDLQALMGSQDVQEGIQSFIERRDPVFKGK